MTGSPDSLNIKAVGQGVSLEHPPGHRPSQLPASPDDVQRARAAQAGPRLNSLLIRLRANLARGFGSKLSDEEARMILEAFGK